LVRAAEAQFFKSSQERDRIHSARHAYPRKKTGDAVAVDPTTGEEIDTVKRRVMGFGLGFDRIFATTSVKLPISAYTVFVELHTAHNKEAFSRCFNGTHTLFDLKKWIYEKLLLPTNAYDLSYAEPGKATLTDQLRLLTTQDSLDTRTLATTRAVHNMYKGIPGVHSIGDIGVTRLYLRLKCRTCGDVLNKLQTCKRMKGHMQIEPIPDTYIQGDSAAAGGALMAGPADPNRRALEKLETLGTNKYKAGVPGYDPNIEDIWHRPDEKKHCLFHGRGFELYEAARTHGGHAEVARIYIACGKEPSKKLVMKMGEKNFKGGEATKTISY